MVTLHELRATTSRATTRPSRNVLGQTLDLLGEAIVSGRYTPGSSVPPESVLCDELGVSRTIVREAVKSLVAKGMVTTGPKVGTRVLPESHWNWFDPALVGWLSRSGLTREFLREVAELRRIIEPAAVALAAQRATRRDIHDLEAAYAGMKHAVDHGGDYVRHDLEFHQGLLRAGRNRMLAQMGDALGALLRTSFEIATAKPRAAALSLSMHRAVLDAVIAREPLKAHKASLKLIDSARDDIDEVLASRRRLPAVDAPPRLLEAVRKGRNHAAAKAATR